jgi:hypothetical protein
MITSGADTQCQDDKSRALHEQKHPNTNGTAIAAATGLARSNSAMSA